MRRAGRVLLWVLGGLLALVVLAVVAVVVVLNTGPGQRLVERELQSATGGNVVAKGFSGGFPGALHIALLQLRDAQGVWLTAHDVVVDWAPSALVSGTLRVNDLTARQIAVARRPVSASSSSSSSSGGLPVAVDLRKLDLPDLQLAAPALGTAAKLAVDGHASIASKQQAAAALSIRRLDAPGEYSLDGKIDAAALQATLHAKEAAGGLAGTAGGLPGLGPLAVDGSLQGPRDAVALKLNASAGALRAAAQGTLNLPGKSAELDVTAQAPAMQPRPDLQWQGIDLQAHVRGPFADPEATAHVTLDGLQAGTAAIGKLVMQAQAHAGTAQVEATAEGVRVPGPKPDLLAAAPLRLTATAQLEAPEGPIRFQLSHPLLTLAGTATTKDNETVDAKLTVPDLAPLAAAAGRDVQGKADLGLKASRQGETTQVAVDGTLGISGGTAPLPALLGPDARIGVTASLAGSDVTLSRLAVNGKTLDLSAQGQVKDRVVALDWKLRLAELAAVAAKLQGSLSGQGHIAGPTDDLAVTADITGDLATAGFAKSPVHLALNAKGLPAHPSGTVSADGTLDGAPLTLQAAATRSADGALHVTIDHADWRSAAAQGQLELPPGSVLPLGTMTLKLGNLADFARLTGQKLTGSVEASLRTEQQDGTPLVLLDATARKAGMATTSVGQATLTAQVRDPMGSPVTEAKLAVSGLQAGAIGGGLKLQAAGPADAVALTLNADLTGVGGAPLGMQGKATLDAKGKSLAVAALSADWKGETLRLLTPARIAFAGGLSVDQLRLGMRNAVLEVAGRLSPTLDMTASLRNVDAGLAKIVAPSLNVAGRIEAEAKLTGTPARPTGTARLSATGLRMQSGPGAGVPPAALSLQATLKGTMAEIDGSLTAGNNRLTLAGTAPLAAGAAMDLRAGGRVNLATFNPILGAGGRRAQGLMTLDASVTGTLAKPQASGSLRLANGEVQDLGLGVRLDNIDGLLRADGETLQLVHLTAKAGEGQIAMSGNVGLTAPMPVQMTLTAQNARPLAGDRMNATLNANLALRGAVREHMQLTGRVVVPRAEIRIPEHMPAKVPVLDVKRPGQKAAPPTVPPPDIGLDLTISSPGRIFVRGLGITAEMAGDVHVTGTAANPKVNGGFNMRRGEISLVGVTLTFSKGQVTWDGNKFDPSLDFVATSNNGNIIATLEITGYVSDPKIKLSSTPQLPQDEVLAQLLFHQSAATLSPLQLAEIAQALGQLTGATGGFDPLGALRSGLGLDRLSVGAGAGGKGTAVQAGRYIAPGVYVGAKEGTGGGGPQGTVQVDIAKGLKLEGTVGRSQGATGAAANATDSGTSVGLTYQFQY